MTETLAGGCLCGRVRYRAEARRSLHYLCHCTDCQRYGGGPYHAAIVVAADDLTIEGEPRVWTKVADSGREIARYFCGDCGGHLFTSPSPEATRYSIKAGTLDDPSAFRPAHEIWRQSELAWSHLPAPMQGHDRGFVPPVDIGATPSAGKGRAG